MTEPVFTVDKVGWHTQTEGNPETRERIIRRFWAVVQFLRDEHLLVENPPEGPHQIDDEFSIRSSDLTPQGLALMKIAYDRWLKRIDHGGDPEDVGVLERALRKLQVS